MRISTGGLSTDLWIRNVTIQVVGELGMSAGLRDIAAAGKLSVGVISYHFISKAVLLDICDAHVLDLLRSARIDFPDRFGPGNLLGQLAVEEGHGDLLAYIVRSLESGGTVAETVFEQAVVASEQYLADGVAAGWLRSSPDPQARARFLTMQNVGGLLLSLRLGGVESADFRPAILDWAQECRDSLIATAGVLAAGA